VPGTGPAGGRRGGAGAGAKGQRRGRLRGGVGGPALDVRAAGSRPFLALPPACTPLAPPGPRPLLPPPQLALSNRDLFLSLEYGPRSFVDPTEFAKSLQLDHSYQQVRTAMAAAGGGALCRLRRLRRAPCKRTVLLANPGLTAPPLTLRLQPPAPPIPQDGSEFLKLLLQKLEHVFAESSQKVGGVGAAGPGAEDGTGPFMANAL
jgi:hypothetical protein